VKVVKETRLFFQEGTSDKVYFAAILDEGGGKYTVRVEWGRRGTPLSQGTKAVKVSLDEAQRQHDKVVREKTGKGYQEIAGDVQPAAVAPPVGEGSGSRAGVGGRARVGQAAQLLNEIADRELEGLLADPWHVAQQKLDGDRILVHVHGRGKAVATNRNGQVSKANPGLPYFLAHLEDAAPGTIVDGELVPVVGKGHAYWLFDLLAHGDEDLREHGYMERYQRLVALRETIAPKARIHVVPVAVTEEEKRALHARLLEQGAEGVVFKRLDAPYRPGRPSSGGAQLKHKFTKTADVFLTANAGNAYTMAVLDAKMKVREVGNVFGGTTNAMRKELDALLAAGERPVAEVEYLYATDDDKLFQARIRRLRDDKEPDECRLSQLAHTSREVVAVQPKKKR
jgi:bifunctional non-homologous end joining protein LigD